MSDGKTRLRVEYSNKRIFFIIASSNVNCFDGWNERFAEPYVTMNGLASIFMRSENASEVIVPNSHYYDPNGNADSAAMKLIEIISKTIGTEPLFVQRY